MELDLLPHSNLKYHTTPASRAQIIDLVAAYYAENPKRRGMNGNVGCMYHADQSELGETYCAVGVFIEDTDDIEGTDQGRNGEQWTNTDIEDILMDPYKGHPVRFWSDLQIFHDNTAHFHPISGLTEEGEIMVKELHATWD